MKSLFRKLLYQFLTTCFGREKLLFLLSNKPERALLGLERNGYLLEVGWVHAVRTGTITDAAGRPLPWVTYPFISLIAGRLNKSLDLFEFGSGNSTYWYAERVGTVTSVEHDAQWYQKIRTGMPANAALHFCELSYGGDYCKYLLNSPNRYDIIIVDGRDRVKCCIHSVDALSDRGIMVLDDSERPEYREAPAYLRGRGFKQLDLWGMAPMVDNQKCTTIFYKAGNCLDI